jgi:hypothetical protein
VVKKVKIDLLITGICLLLAYLIHIHAFLDLDVVWHVEAAKRLLSGGSYLTNIFDDNDPYVYGFYFPVIWLHTITQIKIRYLIIIYPLLINTFFLAFCYYLLIKAYIRKGFAAVRCVYYLLVFSLFLA